MIIIPSTPTTADQAVKGSAYFNGSARLTLASQTPLNPATSEFTIEMFFKSTMSSLSNLLYKGDGTSAPSFGIGLNTSTNNAFSIGIFSASSTWTSNSWNHLAVTRSSGTAKLWLNGVSQGSASDSNDYTNTASLSIGDRVAGHPFGNYPFTGYISNFRIVKGTAVYTSGFTPPTSPLTAISGTTLLTCQNPTTIVDNGPNGYTISNTSATASSESPFA